MRNGAVFLFDVAGKTTNTKNRFVYVFLNSFFVPSSSHIIYKLSLYFSIFHFCFLFLSLQFFISYRSRNLCRLYVSFDERGNFHFLFFRSVIFFFVFSFFSPFFFHLVFFFFSLCLFAIDTRLQYENQQVS